MTMKKRPSLDVIHRWADTVVPPGFHVSCVGGMLDVDGGRNQDKGYEIQIVQGLPYAPGRYVGGCARLSELVVEFKAIKHAIQIMRSAAASDPKSPLKRISDDFNISTSSDGSTLFVCLYGESEDHVEKSTFPEDTETERLRHRVAVLEAACREVLRTSYFPVLVDAMKSDTPVTKRETE